MSVESVTTQQPPQLLVFFVSFLNHLQKILCLVLNFFFLVMLYTPSIIYNATLNPPSPKTHIHLHLWWDIFWLSYEGTWTHTSIHSPTLWASPSPVLRAGQVTWFIQSQVFSSIKGSTSSFLPSCSLNSLMRIDPESCTCFILTSIAVEITLPIFFQLYSMCQYIWSITTEHWCRWFLLLCTYGGFSLNPLQNNHLSITCPITC